MIPHHSCLDVKTITPFVHGSLFPLSIHCWNSDLQNFQTAKTKSKDTWEKVTQREVLWNITPRVEFSDPNYKLIQILYSQLWRISKIHKPGSLHNQPERSSIANEFVYTCMRIHVRYYKMGGMWDKTFPVSSSYLVFQRQPLVLDFDNFGHQRTSSSGVWKCRVMPWWQGITARELKVKLKVWGLMPYCQGITQHNDEGRCLCF
jgi:hypothetical protein